MSARAAAARATLARLGLDPDTLAAEGAAAADRLAAVAGGADAVALADALAEFPEPSIGALLGALEPRVDGRDARKAIRRALYRLRQRGVAVPEPAPVAPPRLTGAEPEGFVTAFGGDGDRILWLVKPLREGGSLVVYGHVHDQRGLLELTAAELSRKKLREVRQRLEGAGGVRLVAADWRSVDALFVEAQDRAGGEDPKRNYRKLRPRITTDPPHAPAEPTSRRAVPPAPDEIAALVAGSAALLAERELVTWMPPLEQLTPFLEELDTAHESPLVLSRGAQEERVRAVIRRAVTALLPPETLARRLEGTAFVLAESGRVPAARQALAVAAALRERPAAVADVPLAIALVERPIARLLATTTARREEEQKGSLVVTPGQFLKERSSDRPTRTRG